MNKERLEELRELLRARDGNGYYLRHDELLEVLANISTQSKELEDLRGKLESATDALRNIAELTDEYRPNSGWATYGVINNIGDGAKYALKKLRGEAAPEGGGE